MKTALMLALTALMALTGCPAEQPPIDEARDSYFASVSGTDEDCSDWLQWCIDEGYPQAACEERNQYCEDGRWIGDDGDDDRPDDGDDDDDDCSEEADEAYEDCIDGGGTEEGCREVAADAYDDCMGE